MAEEEKLDTESVDRDKKKVRPSLFTDVLTDAQHREEQAAILALVQNPDGPGELPSAVSLHEFLQEYELLSLEARLSGVGVRMETLEEIECDTDEGKEMLAQVFRAADVDFIEGLNLASALKKHKRRLFTERKEKERLKLKFLNERRLYVIEEKVAETLNVDDFEEVHIAVIGSAMVGKSSVIRRMDEDLFRAQRNETLHADDCSVYLDVCPGVKSYPPIRAKLWDTCGMEKYHSVATSFFRDKHAFIFAYDITNSNSFDEIEEKWFPALDKVVDRSAVELVLAGMKHDLNRGIVARTREHVTQERAQQLADRLQIRHMQCSALTGFNVVKLFIQASKQVVDRRLKLKAAAIRHSSNSLDVDKRSSVHVKCCSLM